MPPFRHRDGVDAAKSVPSYAADTSTPRKYFPASSVNVTPHNGRRPVASSSTKQSNATLVGLVTETTRDHMKRHYPFNESCPRCHWIKKGEKWSQNFGRVPISLRTPLTGEYWCTPRKPRRGGHWALGCTVCALANESYAPGSTTPSQTPDTSATRKRTFMDQESSVFDTKWARHEVRTMPQASRLVQHARHPQHRRALRDLNRQGSNEAAAEDTPNMVSSVEWCPCLVTGCPLSQRAGGSSPGLPPH